MARAAKVSRGVVRDVSSADPPRYTVRSVGQIARHFGREVELIVTPPEMLSQYSSVAVSMKVEQNGFDSWKLHFFDLVDEFRRTLDPRLILLPPVETLDGRLRALLASTVCHLCTEVSIAAPSWALRRNFLETPWFVSGMQSLKASALLESPVPYRANNIFVHENFLSRA